MGTLLFLAVGLFLGCFCGLMIANLPIIFSIDIGFCLVDSVLFPDSDVGESCEGVSFLRQNPGAISP